MPLSALQHGFISVAVGWCDAVERPCSAANFQPPPQLQPACRTVICNLPLQVLVTTQCPLRTLTVGIRHIQAAGRRQEWRSPGMPARACFLVYVCIVLAMALDAPFPNHFDELAHLSYVAAIAQHGPSGLDLYTMRLLSPALSAGFTLDPNYLNHPPAYYLLLRPFLPSDGWPTLETVRVLQSLERRPLRPGGRVCAWRWRAPALRTAGAAGLFADDHHDAGLVADRGRHQQRQPRLPGRRSVRAGCPVALPSRPTPRPGRSC